MSLIPVTVPMRPLGYLTWGNAIYHIFEVGGRRPPASHATLTTAESVPQNVCSSNRKSWITYTLRPLRRYRTRDNRSSCSVSIKPTMRPVLLEELNLDDVLSSPANCDALWLRIVMESVILRLIRLYYLNSLTLWPPLPAKHVAYSLSDAVTDPGRVIYCICCGLVIHDCCFVAGVI